jgi:hypothetical protein
MLRFNHSGACVAVVLLLGGAAPARAEGADKNVSAIITKAIEAKGGAANLEKYKAAVTKFKGAISLNDMSLSTAGTSREQVPDKLRLDATMKIPGQTEDAKFVQVVNGDKGWQGLNGDFTELDKDSIAEAREQFHAGHVADLRGLSGAGVKLSPLGESKVDGKPAAGVRVSAKGYRDVNLFFDKDTGLLLKSETKSKDVQAGGGEFNTETLYGDYKKVSGVQMPHKVKVLREGKPYMEMEMNSVTLSEKLPEDLFTKPKGGQEATNQ